MSEIRCVLEECKYNQGAHCQAQSIEVRSSHTTNASCADDTACETFAKKDSF